jgi:hypothetical protein
VRSRRLTVLRRVCPLAPLACMALAAAAHAGQIAKLQVGLSPEWLGHSTTIQFAFSITPTGGARVPSPVTRIDLRYPKGFGLVTSGLGLASCTEKVLEKLGPEACPSRSLMGEGTAIAEVQVGKEVLQEQALTAIFMAPFGGEGIPVEFVVEGAVPLSAQLIFPGLLLPAAAPFGGDLSIPVPLLEAWPKGPDVALVHVRSTIGPLGLTYYAHRHGKFVPYTPSGIVLPPRCPAGGFPFSITFHFADGSSATSNQTVPCPRRRASRRRG